MLDGIDNRVGAVAAEDVRESQVVARFSRVAFGAINLFETFGGVYGEAVGAEADDGSCVEDVSEWVDGGL